MKEKIITMPSNIISSVMDCTNIITYQSHQKYILNRLSEKNATLLYIETKARGLDDFYINELLDRYCVSGVYKIPTKSIFVSREEAYKYYHDHLVYYVSEMEYE